MAVTLPYYPTLRAQVVSVESGPDMQCGVCFDTHPAGEMRSAECGHAYCSDCWQGYLCSAIADGPSCLRLRCPMPDCGVLVSALLQWRGHTAWLVSSL